MKRSPKFNCNILLLSTILIRKNTCGDESHFISYMSDICLCENNFVLCGLKLGHLKSIANNTGVIMHTCCEPIMPLS